MHMVSKYQYIFDFAALLIKRNITSRRGLNPEQAAENASLTIGNG